MAAAHSSTSTNWKAHKLQFGDSSCETDELKEIQEQAKQFSLPNRIATLLRSENLNLLIGNGLTTAVARECGAIGASLTSGRFTAAYASAVAAAATKSALAIGRDPANIEDEIRAALQLLSGLQVLASDLSSTPPLPLLDVNILARNLKKELAGVLKGLAEDVLTTEQGIRAHLEANPGAEAKQLLSDFLLAFTMRPASRERLHLFTTNYDRLIEFGCDLNGIRILDRFIGRLEPIFRASRLNVDLHYNPPGIRGEPRYLEGVARLTKLHGSLDWKDASTAVGRRVIRTTLPFGAAADHPDLPADLALMIYPNPAKDIETLEYPYAEQFRDFSASLCQPNATLFTFGYGFGDDHINRVIADMLTLPTTHLVIVSFDSAAGRIPRFYMENGQLSKISLLLGSHLGSLRGLVEDYLPRLRFDSAGLPHSTSPSTIGAP